jgi:pimeloyl-ACP methyl ester carboxylesterase
MESGTGRTMPFACKPVENRVNRTALIRPGRNTSSVIPQNDMFAVLESKAWDDATLFVDACAETEGNKEIASFLSTAFHVRDLANVVDALGEDDMLRFWGRSYGTVVGQTFAAMFPEKIGRMMLDSVLRFDDYISGGWTTATRGTEVSVTNMFAECVKAGPLNCPVANYTGPDTTAESLMAELGKVLQELTDDPIVTDIPQAGQPWWQPGVSVYQILKYAFFSYTYRPQQFGLLWYIAYFAFERNWEPIVGPLPGLGNSTNTTTPATPGNSSTTAVDLPWNLGINGLHGIGCSEAAIRAERPEDLASLLEAQSVEGVWADVFSPQAWVCAQWPFVAKEAFNGPFHSINTSYPVLLINGAYDPVTPLSGAREASENLLGSRLLVHKGHGVSDDLS